MGVEPVFWLFEALLRYFRKVSKQRCLKQKFGVQRQAICSTISLNSIKCRERLSLSNLKCSASRFKMCILRAIDEIPSRLSCCRLHRRWRCKYLGTRTRYPLNQASSSHHHIEFTAFSSSSYKRREGWRRVKGRGRGGGGKQMLPITDEAGSGFRDLD